MRLEPAPVAEIDRRRRETDSGRAWTTPSVFTKIAVLPAGRYAVSRRSSAEAFVVPVKGQFTALPVEEVEEFVGDESADLGFGWAYCSRLTAAARVCDLPRAISSHTSERRSEDANAPDEPRNASVPCRSGYRPFARSRQRRGAPVSQARAAPCNRFLARWHEHRSPRRPEAVRWNVNESGAQPASKVDQPRKR